MQIQVTFTDTARFEAISMRSLRGIATPDVFEGPCFTNARMEFVGEWVKIQTYREGCPIGLDDPVYYYPMRSIARLKVF
jgi:hypothetical protein